MKIGDSIAVDGVCLTVVRLSNRAFTAEVSPETLNRTTLSKTSAGRPVNLEKALRVSDFLGGRLVSGHVDGTGEVVSVFVEGNAWRYRFRAPPGDRPISIEKGSVAVDGISLTVGSRGTEFAVAVIPHTAQSTTLGEEKIRGPGEPGEWT